jgi:hypothetical protein
MKQYVDSLSLGAAEVGPTSREFLAWIARHAVPPAALRFLGHTWVKDDQAFVGAITLMSESAILRQADAEPRWLAAGFLVFGSCMNGDMVALDTRASPGSVWFLSHDELWGDDNADPRRFAVQVAPDLGDLVVRAWDIDNFPLDCEHARELGAG